MQRIKKGDTVEVIAGKDLGERGEVVTVMVKEDHVVVGGVNIGKKHEKAKQIALVVVSMPDRHFEIPTQSSQPLNHR